MASDVVLKTPDGNIHARVWRENLPHQILALHGWLDNLASFIPLAGNLEEYRFTACDLPGHGLSFQRPEGAIYHFIDSVYDLYQILESLQWRKVHLVGHSMGTGVACLFASVAPEMVESLVLIEGFGPLSAQPQEVTERLNTHLRQRKRLGIKRFPIYKNLDDAVLARLGAADISEPAARLIVERGLKTVPDGFTWCTDARLRIKSAHPFTEDQVCGYLKNIQCPVLFIKADPGMVFETQILEGRKKVVTQLQSRLHPGNHHVHMDSAEAIASMIREFYAEIKG